MDVVLAKNKTTKETAWVPSHFLEVFPETWELSPLGRANQRKKEDA